MASDSGKTQHKPGETVQKSGIYRVLHQHHRQPHEASCRAGEMFPPCRTCGSRVRFELVLPAEGGEPGKKVRVRQYGYCGFSKSSSVKM
jgi:hypothetical protein